MSTLFATVFGIGRIPFAPGTWGSAAALPLGYLLHRYGGFPGLALATLAIFALGWWATARYTATAKSHDPSEVVIDEVAGQLIALWPLSLGLWHAGAAPEVFPNPGWVGAFLMFRLFDIWKPWPVSRADAMDTPLGVMLDDVLAGLYAAIVVTIAAAVAHGWLM
jgi:phosphatidylglycerophosphatase A